MKLLLLLLESEAAYEQVAAAIPEGTKGIDIVITPEDVQRPIGQFVQMVMLPAASNLLEAHARERKP